MKYPPTHALTRRPRAFTLIELLTVIAIIGILAAIIIPVVGRVRESARQSQGVSNIRQVTLALIVHAEENKGRLMPYNMPRPNGSGGGWTDYLTQTLHGADLNQVPRRSAAILYDPVVGAPEVDWGPSHHFAFLAGFTSPDVSAPGLQRFKNLSAHKQPSQQIYVADAGLDPSNGWPSGDLWAVDNGWWAWDAIWGGTVTDTQAGTPIAPGNSEPGNIRWTKGRAKFGFLDGHVKVLAQDQVLRRNINPLFQ